MTSYLRVLPVVLCMCLNVPPSMFGATEYKHGPDSARQEGVPQGEVTKYSFNRSKIFPGTVRDYWVYVPQQYQPSAAACVMVFQDGGGYIGEKGDWRVPIVFDNLIHKKEMPVTIGVFINPGVVPAPSTNAQPRFNRSYEYDGMGDNYVRFLLDEILPEVARKYNLTTHAAGRAICGASSGAICAFTAAWERPDAFSKVYSTIGTYVSLRGGHNYPWMIRKTEPKPIRVFLQDGSNDLNIYAGSWWNANQDILAALQFAGYDVKNEWGDGGHNGKQGGPLLPDVVRWLWRDYPEPIKKPENTKQPIMSILIPGEEWQLMGEGYKFTEGPAANASGEVFFTDIPNNRIHKIGNDGKVSIFKEDTGGANGLMFGPDGKLYACQNGKKRIVAYDLEGKETVVANDLESNDLAVSHDRGMYITEPAKKQVWFINRDGEKRVVDTGIAFPNGVRLSPDQSVLLVADMRGQFVWSFSVQPDGSLTNKQAYHFLHIAEGKTESAADGMTVDNQGRLYVATALGVQVLDQPGRVNGIISKPQNKWLANVVFGGPELNYLYATCSDKVYRRKTRAKGVLSFQAAAKPPTPGL